MDDASDDQLDCEVSVMHAVFMALNRLDGEARARVVRWVAERCRDEVLGEISVLQKELKELKDKQDA